jgi:hypothetical protein
MLAYLFVLTFSCVVCLSSVAFGRRSQFIASAMIVFFVALFAVLRGMVGTDTYSYHEMYINYREEDFFYGVSAIEPLFLVVIKLVGFLGGGSYVFVAIVGVVQVIALYWIVARSGSPAMLLAIYVSTYFLTFHFNIIRGGCAALFVACAFLCAKSENRIAFYVFCILSVGFHYSSVLYIPFLFIFRSGFNINSLWYVIVASVLLLAGIFLFVGESQLLKYYSYFLFFDSEEAASYGAGFYLMLLMLGVVFYSTFRGRMSVGGVLFFLLLVMVRWLGNYYSIFGRIGIVIGLLFFIWVFSVRANEKISSIRGLAVVGLVILNLYGSLSGLMVVDQGSRGVVLDQSHSMSPYVPYKFFWQD